MKALLLVLSTACSPALGDPFWQTATLCTTPSLAAVTQDAVNRWHEADPSVNMTVRTGERGCGDADVYEVEAVEGKNHAAGTIPGDVQVAAGTGTDPNGSDRVAHELGHLLIGGEGAHNPDRASVMYWAEQRGEQGITVADAERVGLGVD